MKTQSNFFLALLLTLTATFTLQANPVTGKGKMIVKIEKSDAHSIGVQIANLQKQRTQVSIADVNGKTWFSEYLWNDNSYAKILDLSGMPEGTYVIFIKNKKENYTQAFTMSNNDLALFETESVTKKQDIAFLTSTNANPQDVLITYVTTPEKMKVGIQLANLLKEDMHIQLNSLGGARIISEKVSGQNGYAKKFDLDGMTKGGYYFLFRTDNSTQIQFFMVNKNGVELGPKQELNESTLISKWAAK